MDASPNFHHDVLNATNDLDLLIKHRPTGVDVAATQANWPTLLTLIPEAPRTFAGTRPSKSPNVRRFCPGGRDNQVIGMCFPAGTPVRLADGTEKPIEEIAVGDRVVTHASGGREVVDTFQRRYTGDLVTIEADRFRFPISPTADHTFAVPDGDGIRWVSAGDLSPGDEILVGSQTPEDRIETLDMLPLVEGGYSTRDLLLKRPVPLRRPAVARLALKALGYTPEDADRVRVFKGRIVNAILRHVNITPALGRLFGHYLAEGSCDRARVTWTLNLAEEETANEIVQLVRGCFGVEATHAFASDGQATRYVRVDNVAFAAAWSRLCPGYNDTKRVPGFLMAASEPVRAAVLSAWFTGDGSGKIRDVSGSSAVVMAGVTTSPALARDLATMAASLGIRATSRPRTPQPDRKQAYAVDFSGRRAMVMLALGLAATATSAGVLTKPTVIDLQFHRFGRIVPVRSVTRVAVVDMPVYDFEVEEDHSFIAGGIVVHNCVGKGGRNAAGTVVRIPAGATEDSEPLPTTRFSGLFNYYNARAVSRAQGVRLGGEGAIVAHLMLALQQYGLVPEDWYDESDAAQQRYSDSRKPSSPKGDIYAESATHQLLQAARITSKDQLLDFLGAGYPIVIGKPIGTGYMQTKADGRFELGGRIVGGHCTVIVDYDEKLNRIWERGSWLGWGEQTTDPQFADAGGRNNLGYTSLDEYCDRHLSARAFSSGETDAFVVNVIEGFEQPLIVPIPGRDLI